MSEMTTPKNFELYVDASKDGVVLDGTSTDLLSMNIPADPTATAIPTLHSSGTYTGSNLGSNAAETINLTISAGDIVVVVADFYTGNPGTAADFKVVSLSGGGVSGSWTQRSATNQASTEYSGNSLRKEVWWGLATSAATSVTVTLDAVTTCYASVTAFSVSGSDQYASPFDVNVAVPAVSAVGSGSNSYYHNVTGVSTTSAGYDLVFASLCQVQSSSTPTQLYADQDSLTGDIGSPTLISNNPASSYMASAVEYQTINQILSSATVNVFGGQTAYDYIAYVDAIRAAGPVGTWASTEGTDTLSCNAGVVGGSWHSTGGVDLFYANLVGGPWHSTETTDTFACTASLVCGPWHSTEVTDKCGNFPQPLVGIDPDNFAVITQVESSSTFGNNVLPPISTVNPNTVIIVDIENNPVGATGIAQVSSPTLGIFTLHASHVVTGGSPQGIYRFYAIASSPLTDEVITITLTSLEHGGFLSAIAYAVSYANTSSPFDSGGPVTGGNQSDGVDPLSITTTNPTTIVLGTYREGSPVSDAQGLEGAGYTQIGGTNNGYLLTEYKVVESAGIYSVTQSGAAVGKANGGIVDAIVSLYQPNTPTTNGFVGWVPATGTLTTTDTADICGFGLIYKYISSGNVQGVGEISPVNGDAWTTNPNDLQLATTSYNDCPFPLADWVAAYGSGTITVYVTDVSTGAKYTSGIDLASQQENEILLQGTFKSLSGTFNDGDLCYVTYAPDATGTWHSTEGTDILDCEVLPFTTTGTWVSTEGTDVLYCNLAGGPWHSTEGTDSLSCTGGLVGGSWHSTEAKDTFACLASLVCGPWHSTEATDKTGGSTVFGDGWLGWTPVSLVIGLTDTKDVLNSRGFLQQPFLDGAAATGHGGGPGLGNTVTSVSCTLTTGNTDDVIVVAVINSGFFSKSTSPSTITDTAGLTWHNRLAYNTGDHCYYEVWWAHAPAILTGDVITATLASKTEGASIIAFGIQGANYITPFDTHSGLPVNNWYLSGTSQTANISTLSPNDMLLAFGFLRAGLSQVSTISTINQDNIGSVEDDGYYYGASIIAQGKTVSVAETNLEVTISGSSTQNVGLYLDAVVGWPTGTFIPTGPRDSMSVTGSTLGGSWHSTEYKDTFGGSPEMSPYDDIGWLGWVPATGTMILDEGADGPDIMDFEGDLPPNGTWHSTEGTDHFTCLGITVPPLALDGYATSGINNNGSTTSAVTLSTSNKFDVIVVCVVTGGFWNHGYVTSVTDTAGLTWTKRNQRWSGGTYPSLEIWWAPSAAALTGDVITVHTTATGATSLTAFGVTGAANYEAPWDEHTMAGWMYDNANSNGTLAGGTPPTGTCPVSTLAENTFCFAFGNTALAAFTPPYGNMFNANDSLNIVLSGNTNIGAIGAPWLWTATGTSSPGGVRTTFPRTAGKYYCEFSSGNNFPLTGSDAAVGICTTTANLATLANGVGGIVIHPDGTIYYNGSSTGINLGAIVNTTVIGIAFDMDNLKAWFSRNNGSWNGSGTANPGTNTGGIDVSAVFSGQAASPCFSTNSTADAITVNLGAQTFAYYGGFGDNPLPTGFYFGWPGNVIGTPVYGAETNGYSYVCGASYNINSEPQNGFAGGSYVTNYSGETIFGLASTDFLVDAIVGGTGFPDASTASEVPFYFDGEASGSTIQTATSPNPIINLQPSVDDVDQMYVCAFLISSASGMGTIINMSGGIAGSPGWERRSRVTDTTGRLALEVWWGYSTLQTSGVIACATNNIAAGDTICTVFYAVGNTTHSIADTYEFWDGDVSLPALASSNSGGYPNVTDMNSINQSVLSVVFTGSMTGTIENPVPPYMTDATSGATLSFASNAPNMELTCQFYWSPVVLRNQGAEFNTSPAPTVSVTIGDAILVGTPLPPVGALAVTERKDTCGGAPELSPYDDTGWIGWVPAYCTMATTDTKDYTGGAQAGPPFFGIGWEGFLPLFATFALVDKRDTMATYGWYNLGDYHIIGRMYPTEARDRVAGSNISTHTGTWHSTEAKDRFGGNGFEVPKANPPAPRHKKALLIVT